MSRILSQHLSALTPLSDFSEPPLVSGRTTRPSRDPSHSGCPAQVRESGEAAGSRGHSCLQSCRWRLRVVLDASGLASFVLQAPVCTPRHCGLRLLSRCCSHSHTKFGLGGLERRGTTCTSSASGSSGQATVAEHPEFRWSLKRLSSTSGAVISKFRPKHFFFDSALRTYTVRFLGLNLVRLAAVRLLGDRFVLAL